MKTAYRFFAAVAILAASISITSCNEKIITADELNGTALAFIQEYFPQTAISYIKKDPEMTKTTYEVVLEDGTKIEFNSKREWVNVDD